MINIDKSGANKEAIRTYNKRCLKQIKISQCKYLDNRVEADHRFIKWRTFVVLGFKNFESASRTLTGIEMIRMIKKEQVIFPSAISYKTFCSLLHKPFNYKILLTDATEPVIVAVHRVT